MSFAAFPFYFLLSITFIFYWLLPSLLLRRRLLLVSSFVFYAWWDWRFLFLLIAAASSDFILGGIIDKSSDNKLRFWLVVLSVTINLAILGFFKYFYFFIDSANFMLKNIGLSGFSSTLKIVLPLGISFYTFETISYVVDVYKRRISTSRNLLDYFLFVGFFPHLVAGPILRYADLIPQFYKDLTLNFKQFSDGLLLICSGLAMKIIIADTLGGVVDFVYAQEKIGAALAWSAVFGFGYQIYVDFWSYTLIARGAAMLFCIDLPFNFRQPYLSIDPIDFWRRWHISLSTWFRDYLYIPLGGKSHAVRNTILTMVIAGLWHGASVVFLLWGLYHGLLIVIFRILKLPKFISMPVTFLLVHLGWILFRAQSIAEAKMVISGLTNFSIGTSDLIAPVILAALGVSAIMLVDLSIRFRERYEWQFPAHFNYFKLALASALVLLVAYMGESGATPFIYFNF